jgi:HEPN domain-containing protein
MNVENDPLAWVKHAEEDYAAVQSSLRRKQPLTSIACFHAQQCAEKYLKAMLVVGKHEFPKTHDLLLLNDLCGKAGIFLGIDLKDFHTLSDYAVRVRYPGEDPTPDEAREAFAIAKSARRFARKFLGVE